MEELPDEVALLVLQHIEPLRDTAAVSGTCRRWRRLMLDSHLWSVFHRRVFPSYLQAPGTTLAEAAHELGGGELGGASAITNWRLSFAERARKLKAALTLFGARRLLRAAPAGGHDVLLLGAAEAGCLPLAERILGELVAIHGHDGVLGQGAAEAGCLPLAERTLGELVATHGHDGVLGLGYDDKRSLIDECLCRACHVGSAPMAQLFLGLPGYAHSWFHRNAAVSSGNRQLVRLLFKATTKSEALLRVKDKDMFDARMERAWELSLTTEAAEKGDTEMLKLLVDHGVQPRCLQTLGNAARSGNVECVQWLIDHGYCFPASNTLYLCHTAYYGSRFGRLYDVHSPDVVGLGVESGNVEIVRLLRKHGYPVVSSHVVIALYREKNLSMDMLLELIPALKKGEWNACLTSPTLIRGDVAICRFLVEHGVDVNVVDPVKGRTALHHAVEINCLPLAQCLLACGARTDIRALALMGVTAVGLARQYDTPAARFVVQHSTKSKRARGNKRRRQSSASDATKTQSDPDGGESEDGEADSSNKPKEKKQKKEPAAEKLHEKELEAEVRQLAKLDDKAKVDVFTLRRMLRARGVLAGDIPTRKLALLQLAVDWLRAGN